MALGGRFCSRLLLSAWVYGAFPHVGPTEPEEVYRSISLPLR